MKKCPSISCNLCNSLNGKRLCSHLNALGVQLKHVVSLAQPCLRMRVPLDGLVIISNMCAMPLLQLPTLLQDSSLCFVLEGTSSKKQRTSSRFLPVD